jgi:hypothetical protein
MNVKAIIADEVSILGVQQLQNNTFDTPTDL